MYTSSQIRDSEPYQALEKHLSAQAPAEDSLGAFGEDVESKAQRSEDLEEPLRQAWRAVVTMASTTPHTSENKQKLVDFVLAVQERSPPTKDGEACTVQDAKVWADLPVFGMEMREAWDFAATSDSSAEQQSMWLNLNAWTATLVATVQAQGRSAPDFSLYGIWTIRMALEEEEPSAVTVQAAAMWLLYASSSLYQMSLSNKQFEGKVAKPGFMFKDREWRGYTQHRWASWTRQMESCAKSVSDGERGKQVADALQAMKKADGASCARR